MFVAGSCSSVKLTDFWLPLRAYVTVRYCTLLARNFLGGRTLLYASCLRFRGIFAMFVHLPLGFAQHVTRYQERPTSRSNFRIQ